MQKPVYELTALKNIWIAYERSNHSGGTSYDYLSKDEPCGEILWLQAVSETEQYPQPSKFFPHPAEIGETKEYDGLFTLERIE